MSFTRDLGQALVARMILFECIRQSLPDGVAEHIHPGPRFCSMDAQNVSATRDGFRHLGDRPCGAPPVV